MAAVDTWQITWHQLESQQNRDRRQTNTLHDFLMPGGGKLAGGSSKLRGQTNDSPEVRLSKTLAWILRHGAKSEGLAMRPDGYIRVTHLVSSACSVSRYVMINRLVSWKIRGYKVWTFRCCRELSRRTQRSVMILCTRVKAIPRAH